MQPFGPAWWDAMIKDPSIKSDPLDRNDPSKERLVGQRPHPDLSPRCLRFTDSMLKVTWDRCGQAGFFLAEWIQESSFTSRPVQDRVCHKHESLAAVQRAYAVAVEQGRGEDFVRHDLPSILSRVQACSDKLHAGIESAKGILLQRTAADRSEQERRLNAEKDDYNKRHQDFVDAVLRERAQIEGSKWPRAIKDSKLKAIEKVYEERAGVMLAERDAVTLKINLFNWYNTDLELMLKAIKEAEAELQRDEDLLNIQVPERGKFEPLDKQDMLPKDKEDLNA